MTSGIYRIRNNRTGKEYIGQSKNIEQRFKQHQNQLKNRKHTNKELQADYNRGHPFSYDIIKRSSSSDRASLDRLEEDYIKRHDSKRKGYNRTWGGRTDKYASAEYRKKHGKRSTTSRSRNYRNNYSTTKYKPKTSSSPLTNKKQEIMKSHFEKIKRQNEKEKLEKIKKQQKKEKQKAKQKRSINDINHYRKTNNNNISYKQKNNKTTQRKSNNYINQYKINNIDTKDKYGKTPLKTTQKRSINDINHYRKNTNNSITYKPKNKKTTQNTRKTNTSVLGTLKELIEGANADINKTRYKKSHNSQIICPKCKKENDSTDKFCIFCGTRIKKQFCQNCGKEVNPSHKFCYHCGTELRKL